MRLRWAILLAATALALGCPPATAAPKPPPDLDATAWLLIDASDGARLAANDAALQLPIASATKLMTAYVAMNQLRLSEQVTAPAYAASGPESLLGLQEGEVITVRDLIYALVLASANDGAVALAEAASGNVGAFVEKMNRTAARLGLGETAYDNPVGFDAPGTGSSARDLAELTRILLSDPVFERIADTETRSIDTDRRTLSIETRNALLTQVPWLTGVKTGYTLGADFVLVGSATRDDVSLISVVLGAPSEAARDSETLELLDWGFSLYRQETVARKDEVLARPEVDSGGTVSLLSRERTVVTVRRGEGVKSVIDAPEELEGPITRGERLGELTVYVGGRQEERVPLVAAKSAPAASLSDQIEDSVGVPIWALIAGLGLIVVLIALTVVIVIRAARS